MCWLTRPTCVQARTTSWRWAPFTVIHGNTFPRKNLSPFCSRSNLRKLQNPPKPTTVGNFCEANTNCLNTSPSIMFLQPLPSTPRLPQPTLKPKKPHHPQPTPLHHPHGSHFRAASWISCPSKVALRSFLVPSSAQYMRPPGRSNAKPLGILGSRRRWVDVKGELVILGLVLLPSARPHFLKSCWRKTGCRPATQRPSTFRRQKGTDVHSN